MPINQSLSTGHTLDSVRAAISYASFVFVAPVFNLWRAFCDCGMNAFVDLYSSLYCRFLAERLQAYESHYSESNKANRLSRVEQTLQLYHAVVVQWVLL